LTDERSRQALEIAERYADGEATEAERRAAARAADAAAEAASFRAVDRRQPNDPLVSAAYAAAGAVAAKHAFKLDGIHGFDPADNARLAALEAFRQNPPGDMSPWKADSVEKAAQAELLRDIVGNPYRPAPFDPAWRDAAVLACAEAIYRDRAWERLPELAQALEQAGCRTAEILDHCRGTTTHARGCWVVDVVLGKV
jgi:hypothetical protein